MILKRSLFLIALAALGAGVAQAQTQTGTLLPEIDPQDIEIRGDFRVRFSSLIRQPILGFTNNQRLYALDPNRLPFMESEQEIRASLPIDDLERPIAPMRKRIVYPKRTTLYARAGAGRFNSPEAYAAVEAPVTDKVSLLAGLTYDGGGGHLDENSAYRLMNVQGGFSAKAGARGNLKVLASANSDFNDTNNPAVRKDYDGVGLHAQYRHVTNTLTHTEVSAGYDLYRVGSNLTDDDSEEQRLSARATSQWAGSRINDIFLVHGQADAGFYKQTDGGSASWAVMGLMPKFQTRSNYNSRLTLGARLYYGDDTRANKPYLFPDFKAEFFGIPSVVITAHLYGETYNRGLDGFHTGNRFTQPDVTLLNERNWVADARMDLTLFNAITVFGGFNYKLYPMYGYFQKRVPGLDGALYNVYYDNDAKLLNIHAGAQVTVIPDILALQAKVYNQSHELSDGQNIPFIESSGLMAETQITPFRRIALKGWLHYVGERETGVPNETLDSYLLLNAQGEIMVAEQVGFYVKGLNLLSQRYELWEGYRERPIQLYAGVVVRF